MENMTLLIDPETRDLVFDENGSFQMIFDEDTVAQNIRHTLLTWKGEFFADKTHGTDYGQIVARNENDAGNSAIQEALREAIFQEPKVSRIETLNVSYGGRTLTVEFTVVLASGETISLEVTA